MRADGNANSGYARIVRRVGLLAIAWFAVAVFPLSAGWEATNGTIASAQDDESDSTVAAGPESIAQGVADLPDGDVSWRTLRERAPLAADAAFEARALGFVVATDGAILLVDGETGAAIQLDAGEAAFVPAGSVQHRSSLGEQPTTFLSVELVPADAPPPAAGATVLQPGQLFAAPDGARDLDLLGGVLTGDETVTVPDTGAKNVVLATDGALAVGRPGGGGATLLAGEAASFSGELEVGVAAGGGGSTEDQQATFVVATIGTEVTLPALPADASLGAPTAPPIDVAVDAASDVEAVADESALGTPAISDSDALSASPAAAGAAGAGSVVVEVYTCPPGMAPETLAVAVCAVAAGQFDVTLSGDALDSPLTLADAAVNGTVYRWDNVPFGDYRIAQAVLPDGYETYLLSASEATGDPEAGYVVTLAAESPELLVRIYNFAPA